MGLFCALSVILGTVLSIKVIPLTGVYTLNVSLNLLPVHLAGLCFGPVAGFMVGFLADLIKWAVNPMGAYHPGFGFSMGMIGFTTALIAQIVRRRQVRLAFDPETEWLDGLTWLTVLPGVAAAQILFSVILNSYWIASMSGVDMRALLPTRIVNAAMMIPVYGVLIRECVLIIRRFVAKV
jgi:ECF transporter S component (folate family)